MVRLFDIQNGKVIPSEHCYTLQTLKAVMDEYGEEANKIYAYINFFEENKIPYNKSYLVYINKFNKNIINQLFSYKYEIKHQLIKYRDTQSKRFQKTTIEKLNDKKVKSYSFDGFHEKQDLFELAYKVKNNLLEENKSEKEN